jgi:DegV family protein with EDD domain
MMTFKKIKFVTDSVCDIPTDLVAKWGIGVVPCFVNYGGNSYADDGKQLDRIEYYNQLLDIPDTPTTAAPPPALAQETIDQVFEDADHLFIITTPTKLSAIHNSMRLASQHLPQDRVTLIDSGQVSMALGWQVLLAAEVAQETGSVEATLDALRRVRENQYLYAGLSTMELLRRSGRVSWAQAGVGALLQIKPVLHVEDGEVTATARVRTFRKVIDKLVELARQHAPYDRFAFIHTNNESDVNIVKEHLSDILPDDTITITANPALGTHIGPGAVGIAPVTTSWKA